MDETTTGSAKTDSQKSNTEPAGTRPRAQTGNQPEKPSQAEHGGRVGPDPTRYGDWEKNGRCIDF